jgi:RNA-splicing ligase RtcB
LNCVNEAGVDEMPMACKSVDAVTETQRDLVDVLHTFRQKVFVKG